MTTTQTKLNKQPTKSKDTTLAVMYRCPSEQVDQLDQIAAELGHTRSSLNRYIVAQFIASHKASSPDL